MYCSNCGRKCGDNENFCAGCGAPLNSGAQNTGFGTYTVNTEYYAEKNNEEYEVPYKGFFTSARIMGLSGAILLAASCVMPIAVLSDGTTFSFIDTEVGGAALLFPALILLNTIFDKSVITLSLSGLHSRFMRLKLCILWGLCGIVMLLGAGFTHRVDYFLAPYFAGFVGSIIAIIAPFIVRENDGSGIKPIKKYDYIWIVLCIAAAIFLSLRLYTVNVLNSTEDVQDSYESSESSENSNDTYNYDSSSNQGQNDSTYQQDYADTEDDYGYDYGYDYGNTFEDNLCSFMYNFYSYAWVQSTNNHDSSYVYDYSVDDSPVYYMLGLDYWQQRPYVVFDRIYDVNVLAVEPCDDGSFDVYVYYTYELRHTDTGKTSSNVELAIDNVVGDGINFYMYDHTWINDLPVGTAITISDYYK